MYSDFPFLFYNMTPFDIKQAIESNFKQGFVTSKILLGRCRLIDESSRHTAAFNDCRYLPFYFHLGRLIQPSSCIEIGFRLGLFGACLFQGCRTITRYLGFQQKNEEFYSPRLGIANIKDHYRGSINVYVGNLQDIDKYKLNNYWDLAIINEELSYDMHRFYLEYLWAKMNLDGLIVMDYVTRHEASHKAYHDFCHTYQREPVIVKSRYGVGLIQR